MPSPDQPDLAVVVISLGAPAELLAGEAEPVWTAKLITYHRNATNPVALLRDQFVRGYRYGAMFLAPVSRFARE